jgi:glycosyltransferase involved in cell wall biosynthesis
MLLNKKIVVVMPAYNAALTLQRTLAEIPTDIVDEIVLVDDCSTDKTLKVANVLGLKHVIPHEENKGYGGNQKTCYQYALNLGADIIILLHADSILL